MVLLLDVLQVDALNDHGLFFQMQVGIDTKASNLSEIFFFEARHMTQAPALGVFIAVPSPAFWRSEQASSRWRRRLQHGWALRKVVEPVTQGGVLGAPIFFRQTHIHPIQVSGGCKQVRRGRLRCEARAITVQLF
jgi:hypothetical protein